MQFPRVLRIQQEFDHHQIVNVSDIVSREISSLSLQNQLRSGDRVAITAGSRGITNVAAILKATVRELKKYDCRPFLLAAMGSHGGATPEGQRLLLERSGITEDYVEAPVHCSIDASLVAETEKGWPVYITREALNADHIVVVNRIKPHTDFDADFGSGLIKMIAIGLGNHDGAIACHRANVKYGYYEVLTRVARVVQEKVHILFGLGIVENAYNQSALIQAISTENIQEEEKRLLLKAKELMARIPFDEGDVLIVNEMGKNISGTGMDTNVIGRTVSRRERSSMKPNFQRILVRDLTDDSYGNANGIGLADVVVRRLVNKIDFTATYANVITSTNLEGARIPVTFETDREALEAAISTSGLVESQSCRLVWIKNTSALDQLVVSEDYLPEIRMRTNLKIMEQLQIGFTSEGNLIDLFRS